jgi:sec-independent protein translocase protein TatA
MGISGFGHWIIILIIVLVLFGAGRVSNIMGELGKGIKSFKEGMADDEDEKYRRYEERRRYEEQQRQLPREGRPQEPIDVTPRPAEPSAPPPPRDDEPR